MHSRARSRKVESPPRRAEERCAFTLSLLPHAVHAPRSLHGFSTFSNQGLFGSSFLCVPCALHDKGNVHQLEGIAGPAGWSGSLRCNRADPSRSDQIGADQSSRIAQQGNRRQRATEVNKRNAAMVSNGFDCCASSRTEKARFKTQRPSN